MTANLPQFRPATRLIAKTIVQLNAVPPASRREDWRIAKGLLQEAAGYIGLRQDDQALRMRDAALPYLRFAELVQ